MNKEPKKPIVLDINPVTLSWILVALILIPLVLTGLLSH